MQPFEVYTPKHHAVWHLLGRMGFQGNPAMYSNWKDEDLNRVLKGCCRGISQATFEPNVLMRMQQVLHRAKRGPPV